MSKSQEINSKSDENNDQGTTDKKVPKDELKPYVHIDTFLSTAIPIYNLDRMKVKGFKVFMKGHQYQRNEKVFEDNLKKYLNID